MVIPPIEIHPNDYGELKRPHNSHMTFLFLRKAKTDIFSKVAMYRNEGGPPTAWMIVRTKLAANKGAFFAYQSARKPTDFPRHYPFENEGATFAGYVASLQVLPALPLAPKPPR